MCPVGFLFVEDLVDVDEEFAGYGDDGSLAAASRGNSFVEWFELRVEPSCVLCGFDEDPAYVLVALPGYVAVVGVVGGLSLAGS